MGRSKKGFSRGVFRMHENNKIEFRDTGIYIQSSADGKLKLASDGSGADDITLSGTVTGDADWVTTGSVTAAGVSMSGGSAISTTGTINAGTLNGSAVLGKFINTVGTYTGSAAIGSNVGLAIMACNANILNMTIATATNTAGRFLGLYNSGATGTAMIYFQGGTFDGTNGTAELQAGESLFVVAASSTRFLIIAGSTIAYS